MRERQRKVKKAFACILAVTTGTLLAVELPVVSAENGFKAFCASGRVKVLVKDGVMEASDFGNDSQILLSFAPFPAAAADGITIRYRAFGEWKQVGVTAFTDSGDPVESNEAFFVLHARFAGRKTVTLPRKTSVVDVFARRIVARDVTTFSFDAPLHSTHFFYYGDDADALVDRLNR